MTALPNNKTRQSKRPTFVEQVRDHVRYTLPAHLIDTWDELDLLTQNDIVKAVVEAVVEARKELYG